jgi:tetratricopeptide (TPR) repeat protein
MKRVHLFFAYLFLMTTAGVVQADDRHDLNECMVGDFNTSIQVCTKLLDGKSAVASPADLYTLRGYAYSELGKMTEAFSDFDKALSLAPKSYGTYSLRGMVYLATGKEERQRADSQKALEFMRETEKGRLRDPIQDYCQGLGFQWAGTTQAALSSYDLAIQADPNLAAAYLKRGEVRASRGESVPAIEAVEKAIQLDPQFSAAYLRRAQHYQGLHQSDKALADYNKAIELNARYSAAYFGRGAVLLGSNQFDKAISDFSKSLELRPNYERALYQRAVAYEKKGDKAHAVADYRQGLVVNPSQPEGREALKRLGAP